MTYRLTPNKPMTIEQTRAGFAGRSRWHHINKRVSVINSLDVLEGERKPVRPVNPTWLMLPIPNTKKVKR